MPLLAKLRPYARRLGFQEHHEAELAHILALAGPVCLTYLVSFSLQLLSMVLIGHTGASFLAAAALGNMFANATGNSIIFGLATAIDTLASQAFGAKNNRRIGVVAQRGVAIMLVVALPVSLVWWYADAILSSLGQDAETARLAAIYVRCLIPGLPAAIVFEVLKKSLQAVGLMVPTLVMTIGSIFVHLLLGSILVYGTDLGFLGAPISIAATQWALAGAMVGYYMHHKPVNAFFAPVLLKFMPDTYIVAGKTKRKAGLAAAVEGSAGGGYDVTPVTVVPDTAQAGDSLPPLPVGPLVRSASVPRSGAGIEAPLSPSLHPATPRARASSTGQQTDAFVLPPPVATPAPAPAASASASPSPAPPSTPATSELLDVDALMSSMIVPLAREHALSGWGEFFSLGFPSALMLVVEWGSFEAAAIIAGHVDIPTLAAHTIVAATASLSFMPILGISVAASIRVGQRMGDRKPDEARLTYRVVNVAGAAFVLLNAAFILAVRGFWSRIFTSDDPAVEALISRFLPLLALYTAFDAGQCLCSGALRGVGRPSIAAGANVVSYIVIGLPLAYVLAINEGWGLPGIWAGLTVAVAVAFALLYGALRTLDWAKESEKAHARATADVVAVTKAVPGDVGQALAVVTEEPWLPHDPSFAYHW